MNKIFALLLLLLPGLVFGKDFFGEFPHRKQTKYFEFYYRRNEEKVSEIARFADQFVAVVNRDFFTAKFDYPIRVLVFEDRERFQKFWKEVFPNEEPPGFGVYLPAYKLFATYETSGLGTFTHEILHPLVERNLKGRSGWAAEGIPTFFEKFYGYWEGDTVIVHWGYQNPWRIELIGDNLEKLDLQKIVTSPEYEKSLKESDVRMVSMFLWDHGKFQKFLRLIESEKKNGYSTYVEAAFDKPLRDIIPLWHQYLAEVRSQKEEIKELPPSTVRKDKTSFEIFRICHGLRVEQQSGKEP